jgi:PAS domain S-box-containing protein
MTGGDGSRETRGGAVERETAAAALARESAQRMARRLAVVQEVATGLAAASDVPALAHVVVNRLGPALGARVATLRRLSPAGTLDIVGRRPDGAGLSGLTSIPPGAELPSAHALRRRVAMWVETPDELAARYPSLAEPASASGISSLVALPLVLGDRCVGTLGLGFDAARDFDEEERMFLASIAEHCALALDRGLLFEAERRARRSAEQAWAQLDAIVDHAPLGIAFLDREMRYRRVNRVLAELNGTAPEDHLGRTPRELLPGLPADQLEEAFRRVLETGEPLVDVEVVGEGPAAPGKLRTTLASWYAIRVGDETLGAGVLVREVTAEREAEEFQKHVMGIVGHDLRSPLQAMYAAAAMLSRGAALDERQTRLVERIESSARRMQEIVRAIFDYTQARSPNGVPMQPRPCDVAEICRALAQEAEIANPGREVRVGGEGDTAGEWDPGRLAQMIGNLVANAIRYGPPEIPVEVRWSGGPDEVTLEVANRGPPIPESTLARIFEPFRRGAAQPRGEGLGLGLFIARAVALAHGGRLAARSSPEDGTVFTAVLPRSSPARG